MSIIRKMRKQKAIWWRRLEPDQYGKFAFKEPLEIDCRWDDMHQEFRNASGQLEISKSIVYTDRVVELGDRLKRGAVYPTVPDDPLSVSDAYEVKGFAQTPNLKATETLYTAYL
jgi:hypothetical protein